MRWFGISVLAGGLLCVIVGIALEYEIARLIWAVNAANVTPESAALSIEWMRGIYWPAPYLLWTGVALMVVGGVIEVVRS